MTMTIRQDRFRFVPMILVMGTIFFLSHQPGDTLLLPDVPNIDKVLHALIYGLLAATTLFAVQGEAPLKRSRLIGILVIFFCLFYGISDEWHQSFIPGRMPSIWDIAADTTGAALMVFLWFRFLRGGWLSRLRRQ
jgi:VanZ family protein